MTEHTFSSCRVFVLNNELISSGVPIYVAKKNSGVQSEWALSAIAARVWSHERPTEWRKRISAFLETVKTTHSLIWPDDRVPELLESKHKPNKKRNREDSQIFHETTIPTSMVFSTLLTSITNTKRNPKDKEQALLFFRQLVQKVIAVSCPGGRVELLRGSKAYGAQWAYVVISGKGTLQQSKL